MVIDESVYQALACPVAPRCAGSSAISTINEMLAHLALRVCRHTHRWAAVELGEQ